MNANRKKFSGKTSARSKAAKKQESHIQRREMSRLFNSWNTSDLEEIEKRKLRARESKMFFENIEQNIDQYYSTFKVGVSSTNYYLVEIRSLNENINSCDCQDYRSSQLGTCKHIEYTLLRLQKKGIRLFKSMANYGSNRIEIFLDHRDSKIYLHSPLYNSSELEKSYFANAPIHVLLQIQSTLQKFFSSDGSLLGNPLMTYRMLLETLQQIYTKYADANIASHIRVSRHIDHHIQYLRSIHCRQAEKEAFLLDLAEGKQTTDVVTATLHPYQIDGMLHLAFTRRALLADEMGLGKTIQAIAACMLLKRIKNIQRVLVVVPASLKVEWEEQIAKFTGLSSNIIYGSKHSRLKQYSWSSFFHIVNYEQVVSDIEDIQRIISPCVVILDEAQRIKNWRTKAALSIKKLRSPYAFVLTGTPLENRIDDIYSIIEFLDTNIFGSLFRFNRKFYRFDEKGKPNGYQNLNELFHRLKPIMLRRLKRDVENDLPERTISNYYVSMHIKQEIIYLEYSEKLGKLLKLAKDRPLTPEEFELLQRYLACMRMLCDTPYILDSDCKICPKLTELENIINELLLNPTIKIIIFSEWERMLILVDEMLQTKKLSVAWHTGSVPQKQRRSEINNFKQNEDCRIFLSTDSGSVGLNLQNAQVVINLDLPWNPAKLEQRIARAWRKHQKNNVQVINLITENSIEHKILYILEQKSDLAKNVLDFSEKGNMDLPSTGSANIIDRLQEILGSENTIYARNIAKNQDNHSYLEHITQFVHNDVEDLAGNEGENFNYTIPALNNISNSENIKHLCDAIVRQFEDKLLLLETYNDSVANANTMLIVVDQDIDNAKKIILPQIRHLAINLEILDKNTYEMLCKLECSGMISINQGKNLYMSNELNVSDSRKAQKLPEHYLNTIKHHINFVSRKLRVMHTLISEDFIEEISIPIMESIYSALYARALNNNIGTIQILDAPLEENFISNSLIPQISTNATTTKDTIILMEILNNISNDKAIFHINQKERISHYLNVIKQYINEI